MRTERKLIYILHITHLRILGGTWPATGISKFFNFASCSSQEFRQFLCLCEDAEETEVSEEIDRLYRAIDEDSSSSSESSHVRKKSKRETQVEKAEPKAKKTKKAEPKKARARGVDQYVKYMTAQPKPCIVIETFFL